jgi:ferredoxin
MEQAGLWAKERRVLQKLYFAEEEALVRFLESLGAGEVYAAVRRTDKAEFANLRKARGAALALRDKRPSAGTRSFLQPARERVAVYTAEGPTEEGSTPAAEPRVIVGLRACDLKAIAYLDKVFLEGDFRDPFYAARRKADFLVSADCAAVHEACFCAALGGRPYAESGFDLNLTPLASGYVVEAGSDRGRAAVEKGGGLLCPASEKQLGEREALRRSAAEAVEKQGGGLKVPENIQQILLEAQKSGRGLESAGQCVECAACTFICPTCYCFYLYDEAVGGDAFERRRTWDSCILGDYSRMAGPPGAKPTPRPRLRSRFVNRLLHKYAYGPQQFGAAGCVGCGRCIEACFGKIDIREVLREVSRDASR